MTRTALHARYATFVPIATIRVQKKNYMQVAEIKTGQLLKVLLRLTRDLFALFV